MEKGRRPLEHQGNPAAALAILAAMFGVAFVFSVLPTRSTPQVDLLPSRSLSTWIEAPRLADRAAIRPMTPGRGGQAVRRAVEASPTVDPLMLTAVAIDPPLTFGSDVGEPPALVSTPMMWTAAAVAVEPATAMVETLQQRPPPASAVSAAFDRTGSAILTAFRKTGAGVKTAFSAFAP